MNLIPSAQLHIAMRGRDAYYIEGRIRRGRVRKLPLLIGPYFTVSGDSLGKYIKKLNKFILQQGRAGLGLDETSLLCPFAVSFWPGFQELVQA